MRDSKGSIFLELILVLPLIVFIAIGSVDIAQAIRSSKAAATLSREMASIAFRECSIEIDECQTAFSAEGAFAGVAAAAAALDPNARVAALYWSYNSNLAGSACDENLRQDQVAFVSGVGGEFPRYTCEMLKNIFDLKPLLSETDKRAAVGEAFVPYNPLMPFMSRVLGVNGGFHDEMILF